MHPSIGVRGGQASFAHYTAILRCAGSGIWIKTDGTGQDGMGGSFVANFFFLFFPFLRCYLAGMVDGHEGTWREGRKIRQSQDGWTGRWTGMGFTVSRCQRSWSLGVFFFSFFPHGADVPVFHFPCFPTFTLTAAAAANSRSHLTSSLGGDGAETTARYTRAGFPEPAPLLGVSGWLVSSVDEDGMHGVAWRCQAGVRFLYELFCINPFFSLALLFSLLFSLSYSATYPADLAVEKSISLFF